MLSPMTVAASPDPKIRLDPHRETGARIRGLPLRALIGFATYVALSNEADMALQALVSPVPFQLCDAM